jgi:hypothetical protein
MLRKFTLLLMLSIALLALPLLGEASTKHLVSVHLPNAKSLEVNIFEYINSYGQKEMRFETNNRAKVILGHGRDVNNDGTVDTFFIFGNDGLKKYTRHSRSESSLGRAYHVLTQHAKYSGRDYFIGIATRVLTFLFIAVDHINEAQITWYKDWMDLEELSMEIERNKNTLSREELIYAYNLMLDAGRNALKEFEDAFYKEYPAWFVADTVLWLSGGVVLKWAAKGVGSVSKRVFPKLKKLGSVAAAGVGLQLTATTTRASVRVASKAITAKGIFNRSKSRLFKGMKNIRAEWKYIAYSASIQTSVEAFAKRDEIYDEDPKAMAQNMLGHPGIQENISIGLTDTLAMTAAHGAAQTRYGKFALMGIIGASSSLGVGTALSGSQTKERIIFDTAWTVGVDSTHMMLDFHVLHKFQTLATKAKNPRLKIVGYAIVFVTQVAGYYGYAKGTEYFDPKKQEEQGELRLVPIEVIDNLSCDI